MNFLAHAWLAGESPALVVGGVFGDWVKGPLPGTLPADLARGVALHRAIDAFAETDSASGDARLTLKGTTDAEEMPYFSSEEIAGESPLIRAFAANGWLRLTASGETTDMAATVKGKDAIARFVRFCNG